MGKISVPFPGRRLALGKPQSENNLLVGALGLYFAAVEFHDLFGDGQPQSGAAGGGGAGGVQTEKLFKDPPQLFGRDGLAMIADLHFNPGILPRCRYRLGI